VIDIVDAEQKGRSGLRVLRWAKLAQGTRTALSGGSRGTFELFRVALADDRTASPVV